MNYVFKFCYLYLLNVKITFFITCNVVYDKIWKHFNRFYSFAICLRMFNIIRDTCVLSLSMKDMQSVAEYNTRTLLMLTQIMQLNKFRSALLETQEKYNFP